MPCDKIPRSAHDSSLDLPLTPAENNEKRAKARFSPTPSKIHEKIAFVIPGPDHTLLEAH